MATVEVPEWFEKNTYFENKLASWIKDGGDEAGMDKGFLDSGYSLDAAGLYQHFLDYGNSEGISPNAFFNTEEYLHNKTAQFYNVSDPTESQIQTVADLINEAGMTPWDHYHQYGWQEGVDPSATFDTDQYMVDKLAQLGPDWTMDEETQAFVDSGMDPIMHLELYGKDEGLDATPVVPGDDAAPQVTGVPDILQRVPVDHAIDLADFQIDSSQIDGAGDSIFNVSLVADNGEIGGVTDSDPDTPGIQLAGSAATINDALAGLTFQAEHGGLSSLGITVSDGHTESTATYSMTSAADSVVHLTGNEYMRVIGDQDISGDDFTAPPADWENGNMLSYSNPLVVDAEKMAEAPADATPTHDDNMCWAAQTSNLLTWSGWAQQSSLGVSEGANAEDAVFDAFKDNFLYGETEGGDGTAGIQWFFDGTYPDEFGDDGDKPQADSGNYLGMDSDAYVCPVFLEGEDPALLPDFLDTALDLGLGVGVDVMWFESPDFSEDNTDEGGHAITCWGYTYDPTQTSTDGESGNPGYLTGLVVSDSDDNRMTPPEEAPDRLKVLDLAWDDASGSYYTDSYEGLYGQVEDVFVVMPNSALYDTEVYNTPLEVFEDPDTVNIVGQSGYDMAADVAA